MSKTFYKCLFDAFASTSSEAGVLSARQSQDFSANMESLSFANGITAKGNADLTSNIADARKAYTGVLSKVKTGDAYAAESFDAMKLLTKAQIEAGFGAYVSGYTTESLRSQINMSAPSAPSNHKVVRAGSSIEQYDPATLASLESFDGASKEASIYLSMVIAMGAARQEDFVEAFCPTVPVKPTENGVYVTVRFSSFVNDYYMDRSKTALVDETMGRKPIIKHIYDAEVMGQDRTLVVPSWTTDGRTDSADATAWLVSGVKVANDERGETISSGYYKVSTDINIIQLGQSPLDLARRGTADNTDNLLPGVMMDKLLVSIQPKSASAEAKISFNLSGVHGRAFTDAQSGHNKQIALTMTKQRVAFKLGAVKDYLGTAVDFAGCTEVGTKAGWSLVFELTLSGSGNLQTGTFNVSANLFKLVDILDDKGVSCGLTDTSTRDLADAFSASAVKLEVLGYTMIAYRANTNLRTSGQLIQSDGYAFLYPVAFKSPFRVQGPVSQYTGNDGDFEVLNDAINAITDASNFIGVRKILSFCDQVQQEHAAGRSVGYNPSEDYNSALLKPYFLSGAIDLSTLVDSLKSQDRTDDIRAALHNRIREDALRMLTESGYKVAFDRTYGQERKKMTVLVGTHYHLGQYLCAKNADGSYSDVFALTEDINCKIVTTMNPALINSDGSIKMLMTFSVTDKIGTIDTVQKLHPGFRLYAPVVTVTLDAISENSTVKKVTQLVPKYEHHLTMKVMTSYSVSGIDKVIGKVAVNFHVN